MASPVIDMINDDTFWYDFFTIDRILVGGFNWNLTFGWHSIPDDVKAKLEHPWAAVETPTIAGGLFTVRKDFFESIGAYDPEFRIWGGENIEISFRVSFLWRMLAFVQSNSIFTFFIKLKAT